MTDYEIRIKDRIGDYLVGAFEGLAVATRPVETVISGQLSELAALHRLLDRVASLGLELVEVRQLPPSASTVPASHPSNATLGGTD